MRRGGYAGALLPGERPPPHPTLFLRRTLYERFGVFNTGYRIAAGYEQMLRMLTQLDARNPRETWDGPRFPPLRHSGREAGNQSRDSNLAAGTRMLGSAMLGSGLLSRQRRRMRRARAGCTI